MKERVKGLPTFSNLCPFAIQINEKWDDKLPTSFARILMNYYQENNYKKNLDSNGRKILFANKCQYIVDHTAFLHPSYCLEISGLFNNSRNLVFSTQGILLTTSECYCWKGPSQNVPFFPMWNWLHHELHTCFHAILNVWVSSLFWAAREGGWQALGVSSREWVCCEKGQNFLAAESKEAVSQGKL